MGFSSHRHSGEKNDRTNYRKVPCRGTAPNLTLDLNAKRHAHLFWDAREVTAEGSEIPLRGSRAFSASVPLHPAT